MIGIGPKLPISKDDIDGHYVLIKTLSEEIQQNLKHLVMTNPGERVMDIQFGVGIRRFLFEQMVPQTEEKIDVKIRSQVKKYLPFVKINSIRFDQDEFRNLLGVAITYNVPSLDKGDMLLLNLT